MLGSDVQLLETIRCDDVHGYRLGVRIPGLGWCVSTSVVMYYIDGYLIDTGPSRAARVVRSLMRQLPVDRILLTHHHEDHAGNAAVLGRDLGVPLHLHAEGQPCAAHGISMGLARHAIWGPFSPFRARDLEETFETRSGITLAPIHTPGHCPDLTTFLLPQRGILLSGDLYIARRLRYFRKGEDIDQHIASLRSVLACDFQTLCCAHRGVVTDGKAALGSKLDYFVSLRERAGSLYSQGIDRREIRQRLLGREDPMTVMLGFEWSKQNLIDACLDRG